MKFAAGWRPRQTGKLLPGQIVSSNDPVLTLSRGVAVMARTRHDSGTQDDDHDRARGTLHMHCRPSTQTTGEHGCRADPPPVPAPPSAPSQTPRDLAVSKSVPRSWLVADSTFQEPLRFGPEIPPSDQILGDVAETEPASGEKVKRLRRVKDTHFFALQRFPRFLLSLTRTRSVGHQHILVKYAYIGITRPWLRSNPKSSLWRG